MVSRPWSIVAYDFGIKKISFAIFQLWCESNVVPADTTADDVLEMRLTVSFCRTDRDPGLPYAVESVRRLIESGVPMFGIRLGHQLIGRALGAEHIGLSSDITAEITPFNICEAERC
jgi:carbamoyl-phosphate synthase small subunit